jgi:hypothetical protein
VKRYLEAAWSSSSRKRDSGTSTAQHFRTCTGPAAGDNERRLVESISTGKLLWDRNTGQPSDSRRRKLPMRYARILSIGLVATVGFAWGAAAVENAHELAGYCQSLERGAKGAGRQIYISRTREALTCWGYMQAMQDLSVLSDEEGHRIMGACPPEQTSTLQLIQSFVRYARAHSSELPGNAVVAVFRALREAYPCRAEHGD